MFGLKKLITHGYLFALSFISIVLNKIGVLTNLELLEVSLAQICISTLSGIYLFRFPDEKPKLTLDIIFITLIVYGYSAIDNKNFQLNWFRVILYSVLFSIRDLVRLNKAYRKIKIINVIISVFLIIFLYFNVPKLLALFFLPLIPLFLFFDKIIIELDSKFQKRKLRYFLEDIPLLLFTYILTVQSFKSLGTQEYSDLRFYISLTSVSVVLQYMLFQTYFEGLELLRKITFKQTVLMLSICLGVSFLFKIYEIGIVLLVIFSGVYYFFLKSIKKIKYLFFLNLIPLIVVICFVLLNKVNYVVYFVGIFISAVIPILFYHFNEIKNKSLPTREK